MHQYLIVAGFVLIAGCKSGTKNNTGDDIKKDSATVVPPKSDTTIAAQTVPESKTGKIDIESFGDIKIGQHYPETIKALGQPDSKSKATEWGADGLLHEDWTWKSKGLVLNMSSDKNNVEGSLAIFSITANAPCTFKTNAGTGIGSSYAEVQEAYKRDINPDETTKEQITVGSMYGGIIFSFKNDKVLAIFLGAAAE